MAKKTNNQDIAALNNIIAQGEITKILTNNEKVKIFNVKLPTSKDGVNCFIICKIFKDSKDFTNFDNIENGDKIDIVGTLSSESYKGKFSNSITIIKGDVL